MAFEVLVRTPSGRLSWKPVDDCINHKEAREQGSAQYAGKVLSTRSVSDSFRSGASSAVNFVSNNTSDVTFFWIVLGGTILLVVTFWPFLLVGGAVYCAYKLFKKLK